MRKWDASVWSYLLLFNMAFPLYFILSEPIDKLVPGLCMLLVMVLLQIVAIRLHRHRDWIILVQLVIIVILGFVYHPMYTYLVFLIANHYRQLKMRWMVGFAAGFAVSIVLMMTVGGYAGNLQVWINMMPPIFGGVVLPFVVHVSGRYREMAERLQAATKEIERLAQQSERQRIAQELHDTLGHTLSLLTLKGEVVERMVERAPDRAKTEAREIQQTAAAALRRMRELVTDMKVVRLSEEWGHARSLCAAANIQLHIHDRTASAAVAMTPLQESVFAMCMREALTNVVRHSRATTCTVELSADEEWIRCSIIDNGVGMSQDGNDVGSNGIVGMKQRLSLLEGHLEVEASSSGTTLHMMIPIVRKQYGGGS